MLAIISSQAKQPATIDLVHAFVQRGFAVEHAGLYMAIAHGLQSVECLLWQGTDVTMRLANPFISTYTARHCEPGTWPSAVEPWANMGCKAWLPTIGCCKAVV